MIIPEHINGMMYSSEWGVTMEEPDKLGGVEATNDFLLESWLTEQDPSSNNGSLSLPEDDDDDMMMVDAVEGFVDDMYPPTPPAGRLLLEEALEDTLAAAAAHQGDDDDASFFTTQTSQTGDVLSPISSSSPSTNLTSFLPLEQRYQATLDKLTESMKKSQETRKSLRIQTSENMEYNRWNSISGTLSSIEKSTQQLQQYLKTKKPAQVL